MEAVPEAGRCSRRVRKHLAHAPATTRARAPLGDRVPRSRDRVRKARCPGSNRLPPVGYFPLPRTCWLDHYYRPMQRRFAAFLDRHDHSTAANEIVAAEQHEIDLYERFSDFVNYGFYIAARTAD